VPELLPLSDTTVMTTPSELFGSDGYACGWWTSADGTWYHNGVLPGSRSFMARTADGFCLAALVNSGRTDDTDGTRDTVSVLEGLMWIIRAKVDYWNTVPF
jgi:hypothetical protein